MTTQEQIDELGNKMQDLLQQETDPVKRARAEKALRIADQVIGTATSIAAQLKDYNRQFPTRKRIFQPRNRRPMKKQQKRAAFGRVIRTAWGGAAEVHLILQQPVPLKDYPAGGMPFFSFDMATGSDHTAEAIFTPDGKVVELPADNRADLIMYEAGQRGGKTVAVQAWKDLIVYPSGPPYVVTPIHEQKKQQGL